MKSPKLLFMLLVGLMLLVGNSCQTGAGSSSGSTELKIDYEKYTLENGTGCHPS